MTSFKMIIEPNLVFRRDSINNEVCHASFESVLEPLIVSSFTVPFPIFQLAVEKFLWKSTVIHPGSMSFQTSPVHVWTFGIFVRSKTSVSGMCSCQVICSSFSRLFMWNLSTFSFIAYTVHVQLAYSREVYLPFFVF